MCEGKCSLTENVCDSKQECNCGECWCDCRELNYWVSLNNNYMRNCSTNDCECNKSCKNNEYLDIENCLREKHFFGKLVLACKDDILNSNETSLDDNK